MKERLPAKRRPWVLVATTLLAILMTEGPARTEQPPALATPPGGGQRSTVNYAKLPLSFEANQGQTDPQVKFLSRGPGYTLFLTADEAVLRLKGAEQPAVLRLKLVGANPSPQVSGLEELHGRSNYFLGNDPSKWRTNVPHFAKVRFEEVYPGIDLVYYGTEQGQLEYDFILHPGADPASIRINLEGIEHVEPDARGNLRLPLPSGEEVVFGAPLVYQEGAGGREELLGAYAALDGNQFGFQVENYATDNVLVIDPVLTYSTYLGGLSFDEARAIAVDPDGSAYLTGIALSPNLPITPGSFQPTPGDWGDIFVAKFSSEGSSLVYLTYLGGSDREEAWGIALDANKNAYVTGRTSSHDFPVTPGAFDTACGTPAQNCEVTNDWQDAFVTKLNFQGTALEYSTFLGGGNNEHAFGIAVDSNGRASITGSTQSTDFPITASAFRSSPSAVFVSTMNPQGSSLDYSTYLGGMLFDAGLAIAVDGTGKLYVTGIIDPGSVFPVTPGAFQTTRAGSYDAFVAKLDPNAIGSASLLFSTFLGGSDQDFGLGIAVDSSGNSYVTGATASTNFPTINPIQPTRLGTQFPTDVLVSKLNPAGSALIYSTYLGGSNNETGEAIAVDQAGNAYVAGWTFSEDFPLVDSFHPSHVGGADVLLVKINPEGSALAYSTLIGGGGGNLVGTRDEGYDVALDQNGNAYVAGLTLSALNFPSTPDAFQPTYGGSNGDGFVAKVSEDGPRISSLSPSETVTGGPSFTLTVHGSDFLPDSIVFWNRQQRPTEFISDSELQASISSGDLAIGTQASIQVWNPSSPKGLSAISTFTVSNAAPTTTSLSPSAARAGFTTFTLLTVRGSGFVPNSKVRWNGMDRGTEYIGPTELRAQIQVTDFSQVGTIPVTVFNPQPGGGLSEPLFFEITADNPIPEVTSISPASAIVGQSGFALTVNGYSFYPGAVVRWNGLDRNTIFLGHTTLQASIPASDIGAAGPVMVTVFNPPPGGGSSNPVSFTIIGNLVPIVSRMIPDSIPAGSSTFSLRVRGTGLVSESVVLWNGVNRSTSLDPNGDLLAVIPSSSITDVGTAQVSVFNPAPGGGTSNSLAFAITLRNPLPTVTSLSPNGVVAGTNSFMLNVSGSNFVFNSEVQWDGAPRTTTFLDSGQLQALISATDLEMADIGSHPVTVLNPAPGGGTSNAVNFNVLNMPNPAPVLASIDPTAAVAGSVRDNLTLMVNGANFINGSVVRWNGIPRLTTFINGSQLLATIPASDLVSAGAASVTVLTPGPGGGISNALPFIITNPAPTLNSISPNTAMAGDPAFTLVVQGANFLPGSVVRWNGDDRPTTFIGSNQLRAAIPAADLGPQKSPDPYSSGHILVNRNDSIVEVTLAGEQLLSVPIPWPDGPRPITEDSRDLIIDSEGNIVIYNGTFDPFLSTLDPTTITWTHRTHSGWSTINNGSYGGIGRFQNLVFVTDMTTFGSVEDQLKGIIRFDLSNNTSVRFADAQQYEDLTVGLDGMLYALRGGNTIDVYHPATLQFVRTLSLPVLPDGTRGIAVNASGEVFGAAWDGAIRRYDPNGNLQDTLVTGVINLSDIDLAPDGTLIAGSQLGDVIITNETLDGMSSFAVGGFQIFVAFGTLGTALVTAANPAPGGGVSAALPFTFNMPSQATTSAMPPALPPPPSAPGVPPPAAQPAPWVVAAPAAASSRASLPAIESLRPATIVAGSGTLKLLVRGENFTEESVVRWRGKDLPTKFIRSTELEVELPADALAQPGELKLTVFTPGPAGGSSKPATLTVTKD